jgi:hypothetical protein
LIDVGNRNFLERIASLRGWLREWLRFQQNRYRPERHYMRGPGPKAREKAGTESC